MSSEQELALLVQARELLRQVAAATGTPAVFQAVQMADMNLHWASWHLGAVDEIMPQLEHLGEQQ